MRPSTELYPPETSAILHLIGGGPADYLISLDSASLSNKITDVITTVLADARDRQTFSAIPTPLWERLTLYLFVGGILLVPVATVALSLAGPSLALTHSTIHCSQLAIAVLGVTLSGLAWLLLKKEDTRKVHMGPLQRYRATWHRNTVAQLATLLQDSGKLDLPTICQHRPHTSTWLTAAKETPTADGLPFLTLLAAHRTASELATCYDPSRIRVAARLDAALTLHALYELLEQPPRAPSRSLLQMSRTSSLDELRLDLLVPYHCVGFRRALQHASSTEDLLPRIRNYLGLPRLPKQDNH